LFVEELGQRICPSTLIPVANHRDLVYDATRNQLDITTSTGVVQRYDIGSQSLLAPLTVGTSLNGADITSDGSALYVTEGQTANGQGVLHRADLTSGAVTDLPYNLAFAEGGSFDIALGSAGKGLFDGRFNGSGWVPLRQVDLNTNNLSIRTDDPGSGFGGQIRQNTTIHRSADRSLFIFTESNISSGPVFTYNATNDRFSTSLSTNVFLDNSMPAVSRNGRYVALIENGGVKVMTGSLGAWFSISGLTGGVAFDPLRDIVYAVDSAAGQVDAYNANSGAFEFALAIGETYGSASAFGNGVMTLSSDDRYIFLTTPSGVRQIDVPAFPATHFLMSGVPENGVAGTPFGVTLTALDQYNNLVPGYAGTVHFTSTDPLAALPADYTFTAADLGTHTFTNGVTLFTASGYPGQTVTVTDTANNKLTVTGYDRVQAAAATSYQLSAPAAVAQGSPFTVTLTAFDPYGNVATGYGGTAHFTSSDGAAGLPADYKFQYYDRGQRVFTSGVTLNTLGSQSVTATDTTNALLTATATPFVNPEPPGLHFTVSTSVSTTTAGTPFDVTVTALDANGNVVTGYTGTATFATSDTGARVVLPAPYTFTSGDAGVHSFSGVTLVTAGSQTITVYDRGITNGSSAGSAAVQINPAAARYLTVSGFPSPVTAGTAGTFTVTARDSYGNLATGYTGTVGFSSTDTQASLPGNYTFTAADAGVHSFTATFKTVPSQTQSLAATDVSTTNITGTQFGIVVNPAAATHLAFTLQGPITAGTAVTFQLTALDVYGNEASGYRGTVQFTSSDTRATLPADYTYTASDSGQHAFNTLVMRTAGTQTIAATDTTNGSVTGTTTQTVVPGSVAQVYLFSPTAPLSTTAGQSFTLVAQAQDACANVVPSFTGKITWSCTDPQGTLPSAYTFTSADQGMHTFTNAFTMRMVGTAVVTDAWQSPQGTVNSSVTDTVVPAAASRLILQAPFTATAGSALDLGVVALDPYNNVATGYRGTVRFTSSDATATLPGDYTFTAADAGTHTFTKGATLDTAGNQTVTATDTASPGLTATSSVTVSAAAATHFRVTAPASSTAGTSFDVTITVLDQFGNTVTAYTGTVRFTSSDYRATLPGNYTFTAGDAGVHTFAGGVTLYLAGMQTITATDTQSSSVNGTASVLVNAAAPSSIAMTAPPSATAGTAFDVTVTALDAYGNTAPSYAGTVHFTSSDTRATLPSDYTFTSADAGSHTFAGGVTFDTAGAQSVTATDTASSSLSGSATVVVSPAAASRYVLGAPSLATAGTAFNITLLVLDKFNNVATGYRGTAHFTSSDAQAALPADYTFVAGDYGSHSFSVTLKTAGSQSLTATDTATSSLTDRKSISVFAAAASSLTVTAPTSATAGAAFDLTVTALDAYGNVATSYTATVHFTSSDHQASLPADYTFGSGDAGSHIFANGATLDTAGTQTVTATDTQPSSLTGSASVAVSPAAASHLVISAPQSSTAGSAFTVIVTALDQFNNVAAGYAGTVHFTSTDNQAALPADYTFTGSDAGSHAFANGVTLDTAGTQTITATDTNSSSTTGSASVAVGAAAASHFQVSAPQAVTAGSALTVSVTALDRFNNVATGYTGTVHFTSSDRQASLPADSTLTSGKGSFSATLKTAGSQSITATDTASSSITGTQSGIVVSAAAAGSLALSGFPSTTTAGVAHTLTVTAFDAYGNVVTGYRGAVHFTSSDGQAALPADYAFTASDAGAHAFSVTLLTAGTQSLTVTDKAAPSLTATQSGITVSAGAAATFTVSGYPSPTTAGATQVFTVTANDAYGNVATSYVGTVHFTSSDGQAALPTDYTFTASNKGVRTFSATLKTAGSQSITATDKASSGITGTQSGIVVTPAAATHLSITAPANARSGTAFTVIVTALDAYGNVATGYRGTIHFAVNDHKATLPADYTFVSGDNGMHSFSVTLHATGTRTITATDTKTNSITGSASVIVA
jgi:hypothetical protein